MKILKLWELTILLKDDRFEEFKVPMDVINRTLDLKNFINMIFNYEGKNVIQSYVYNLLAYYWSFFYVKKEKK
jgi:hypothetical protein